MEYPDSSDFSTLGLYLSEYAKLKCEEGSPGPAKAIVEEVRAFVKDAIQRIQSIPEDAALKKEEPDDLPSIRALREDGPRRLWKELPPDDVLTDKTEGALIGRFSGCILGVPVEGDTVEDMKAWCDYTGKRFPPTDYWENVKLPHVKNVYGASRYEYKKSYMRSVPVDDDIIYTQLALLILEKYGPDFTTEDVARMWSRYLPVACTAEGVVIDHLKKGVPIGRIAVTDNPFRHWDGASIRSDGFAYAAAGLPERAAGMAYRDAYLSHRRSGIYGEMFLAAAQSAAFAVKDPLEAVAVALTEIPANCLLHRDVEWALDAGGRVKDHTDARRLVEERFAGMHLVGVNNNMCLLIFGLKIGGTDIVKCLSETVAMGLDCDCTAASEGSILGAVIGKKEIPEYLYRRFNNTVDTYLVDQKPFHIDDMARRFIGLRKRIGPAE